jgi:electron transfer flavoprotein beta subunit
VKAPLPLLLTVMDTANRPRPPSAKRVLQYRFHTCAPELFAKVSKAAAASGEKLSQEETTARVEAEIAKRKGRLIRVWTADDVAADPGTIGGSGSPTKVKNIESVVLAGADLQTFEPTDEGCATLIRDLVADHIIG